MVYRGYIAFRVEGSVKSGVPLKGIYRGYLGDMYIYIYRGYIGDIWGLGFPKIRGNILEVPSIRIIVNWGLCWVPPSMGTIISSAQP